VITLAGVYVGAAQVGQADRLRWLLAQLQIESLDLPAGTERRLGELRARPGIDRRDHPAIAGSATVMAKRLGTVSPRDMSFATTSMGY
jgi:hypothetical protein